MNQADLIGKIGSVTTRVRGGELAGEVRIVVSGLPHYYLAYCPHAVPTGTKVLVVGVRGARQLEVEPWEHWGESDGGARLYQGDRPDSR